MAQQMNAPEPDQGGGNFLTQKYGPLPAWGWLLITVILVYIYMRYQSNKTASTTGGTTSTSTTGTNSALTSNIVGVQQPTPVLDGSYQLTITPDQAPQSINQSQASEGFQISTPPAQTLSSTNQSLSGNAGTNVQPQTQSSSPQTQSTPTTG